MTSLTLPLFALLTMGCSDAGGGETGAARTAGADADADGVTTEDGDCDDGDSRVYPGAAEVWYDGIDQDCDANDRDQDLDGYDVADDCDDADATRSPAGTEAEDLVDNDCDGWIDEDFVRVGDIVVTEVARETRFGAEAATESGQWFELHNTSGRDIDLSGWYVGRSSTAVAAGGFYVDPADAVVLGVGEYVVFCKTTTYSAASDPSSTLACDYVWSDPAEASDYAGTYRDNTFTLQGDEDTLSLWVYGGPTTGTLADAVPWASSASSGYWPRDASRSMSLDPATLDGTSNDDPSSWCSTSNTSAYAWYAVDTSIAEYGTPGTANPDCP
jgi:hypothetical protein